MVDCNKVVALIVQANDDSRGDNVTTYGDNVSFADRGAVFRSQYVSASFFEISTYCRDPTPNIGEIMGVKITLKSGFQSIETGRYPNAPERNYTIRAGEIRSDSSEFWLINTRSGPDFWLPGVEPRAEVTPLATTKPGPPNQGFMAWIGDRAGIEQWVRLNSIEIDVTSTFPNFAGGTTTNTVYQYQGWRIACTFPYDALLKYPFCGGLVQGEEAKGPQFINLCENDLGVCGDCCDCCTIAEKLIAQLKTHPLYTTP